MTGRFYYVMNIGIMNKITRTSLLFKRVRKGLDLKQHELADLLGLPHQNYISKYERGETMAPGEIVLKLLELRDQLNEANRNKI